MTPDPVTAVAVHGVSGGSIGIIITVIVTSIGTMMVAYFKILPRLREMVFTGRKDEISRLTDRVTKLEEAVAEATLHANAADERTNVMKYKMVSLNAAFQLVAGEMRRVDPDNAVLKQALDLIAMAATDDMGFGKAMLELSKLPATKR